MAEMIAVVDVPPRIGFLDLDDSLDECPTFFSSAELARGCGDSLAPTPVSLLLPPSFSFSFAPELPPPPALLLPLLDHTSPPDISLPLPAPNTALLALESSGAEAYAPLSLSFSLSLSLPPPPSPMPTRDSVSDVILTVLALDGAAGLLNNLFTSNLDATSLLSLSLPSLPSLPSLS